MLQMADKIGCRKFVRPKVSFMYPLLLLLNFDRGMKTVFSLSGGNR